MALEGDEIQGEFYPLYTDFRQSMSVKQGDLDPGVG